MYTILVVTQVLVAIGLIGLILVQHGKGADAGAAFGSGASGTVFGSRGAANFLTRLTAGLATVFFLVSLTLAYLVSDRAETSSSVVDSLPGVSVEQAEPAAEQAPAAPLDDADAPLAVTPEASEAAAESAADDVPVVPE